ncbi:MAG: hypothetical protein WCP29_00855 [Acidobacteriota bacterium]
MFLLRLFWLFVLIGGWFMGLSALRAGFQTGFGPDVLLNSGIWLACGAYAVPRVWRMLSGTAAKPAAH